MNMLNALTDEDFGSVDNLRRSPLRAWLSRHGQTSLNRFLELRDGDFQKPMLFAAETPLKKFVAYIDPDNRFSPTDKLSQVSGRQEVQGKKSCTGWCDSKYF